MYVSIPFVTPYKIYIFTRQDFDLEIPFPPTVQDDSIESSPEASAFKEFMKRIRVSASIDFRKSSETPSEDHEKDDLVDKSDDPKFKSQQSGRLLQLALFISIRLL